MSQLDMWSRTAEILSHSINPWQPDLDELLDLALVDKTEYELLRSLSSSDQCTKLLNDLLPRKSCGAFATFLAVLASKEDQEPIVMIVEKLEAGKSGMSSSPPPLHEDHRWETVVRPLLPNLVKIWHPDLDRLEASDLLSLEDYDKLDALPRSEQCKKLLTDILPQRGTSSYDKFLRELEGQESVVDMLRKREEDILRRKEDRRRLCRVRLHSKSMDRRWLSICEPLFSKTVFLWKRPFSTLIALRKRGLISSTEYHSLIHDRKQLWKECVSQPNTSSEFEGEIQDRECQKLLIDILPKKRALSFDEFLHVLKDAGQLSVRRILEDSTKVSLEGCSCNFSLRVRGMRLEFTKGQTVQVHVDRWGGEVESEFFSISIPPGAVVSSAGVKVGFTVYEYQSEESKGVKKDTDITDLLVLHPCGIRFAKDVIIKMRLLSFVKDQRVFLFYKGPGSVSYTDTCVGVIPTKVRGGTVRTFFLGTKMSAVLHDSYLDIATKHFCGFLAMLFGCSGHDYRVVAIGNWKIGDASIEYAIIDIYFTSEKNAPPEIEERKKRSPLLFDNCVRIYFSGAVSIEVRNILSGWKLVTDTPILVDEGSIKEAMKCSYHVESLMLTKPKNEEAANLPLPLELHLTGGGNDRRLPLGERSAYQIFFM
ncbi:uncharacterized protein [Oscarella lobularis]|uniref:uncharacterized protein isoform X2 n=1 Tax=Oscarella lobularis TaxID=121494 RepID=UPI0033135AE9